MIVMRFEYVFSVRIFWSALGHGLRDMRLQIYPKIKGTNIEPKKICPISDTIADSISSCMSLSLILENFLMS